MGIGLGIRFGIEEILGKQIVGIVAKGQRASPETQLFLVFHDDTVYEIYGPKIMGAKGVRPGGMDWARNYMAGEVLVEHTVLTSPATQPPHEEGDSDD